MMSVYCFKHLSNWLSPYIKLKSLITLTILVMSDSGMLSKNIVIFLSIFLRLGWH